MTLRHVPVMLVISATEAKILVRINMFRSLNSSQYTVLLAVYSTWVEKHFHTGGYYIDTNPSQI